MIPADQFTIEGDIALLVQENGAVGYHAIAELWSELNRPCDECNGDGAISPTVFVSQLCPDCDGTGRHTFDVEVGDHKRPPSLSLELSGESDACCTRTLRVHVLDVLPIHRGTCDGPGPDNPPHVCWSDIDNCWLLVTNTLHDASPRITLPPAAEPGMWVVRLEVH